MAGHVINPSTKFEDPTRVKVITFFGMPRLFTIQLLLGYVDD